MWQVVPFSPCAGLLQWVENTLPIIDWLAGDRRVSGAHVRYAPPGGCTFSDCFHTMQAAKRGELREKFDQVCSAATDIHDAAWSQKGVCIQAAGMRMQVESRQYSAFCQDDCSEMQAQA